jgi:myo-inositol 2-dehydrogenase/D-chiro-inositol 1-dehydrogenase
MVAFMKRFAVGYRMAKHLVEQPDFGGVQLIDIKFSQGKYPPIWGLVSAAKSFITGQVIHLFDLTRHFGGDVEQVFAGFRDVADQQFGFLVNVRFTSGAIGTLNLNTLDALQSWRDFEERLVVTGTGNQVRVDDMLYLTHRSAEDWVEVPGLNIGRLEKTWKPTGPSANKMEHLIGYRGEIEHFARCAVSNTRPLVDLWDGAAALQLMEAVWESAHSGAAVGLESLR